MTAADLNEDDLNFDETSVKDHMTIPVDDVSNANIYNFFTKTNEFIKSCL